MTPINYNGKTLILDCDAQLDNNGDVVGFFAFAHDENGILYEVRWDYAEPEWYINEEETPTNNDVSDFADWEHPSEVIEL